MVKTGLLIAFLILIREVKAQTVTDIDGNTYNTVTIGAQLWMKENLKTTRFNNGGIIPTSLTPVDNGPASIYQWSYNDDSVNVNTYGRLYSWFAVVVDEQNVCPIDWHVPSDIEWATLTDFLGGDSVAGGKMKETGTIHWTNTDSSVDNSSDFTALPGGFRGNPSGFINQGTMGMFWSATPWGSDSFQRAYIYHLNANNSTFVQSVAVANCGLSVRCISDLSVGIKSEIPENNIRIFPNPTTTKITISVEETGNLKASIYDYTGALVFQQQLTHTSNQIDLNFLAKGVYILKIVGADFSVERKLVKE